MIRTLPAIDARLTLKGQTLDALKAKWPEEIALYVQGLIEKATNILYVAANSHDYFVPPDYKLDLNWWIESFSPKNDGKQAILATTDKGLFDLLQQHGAVNRTAFKDGMLLVPFVEIIASGGKQADGTVKKYVSLGTASAMFHTMYPLTKRLTQLVSPGIMDPEHVPGMMNYGKICYHLFNVVFYHISHQWPVWVADDPTGPVAVFGFNPVLDSEASPTTLVAALRSYQREG